MTERKWTPGPWGIIGGSDGVEWDIYVDGPTTGYDGDYQNHADAHLIAAAPDLYEALEDAVSLLDLAGYSTKDHCKALAKALGRAND